MSGNIITVGAKGVNRVMQALGGQPPRAAGKKAME